MRPRTERVPKVLLPVAGRPFAAWLLERLRNAGFEEVLFCVGHLAENVERELGDGRAFGVRLRYAADGERLLGTGGALRRALPALAPTFLVTYGDSYLPFDYARPLADLRAHPDALGTMSVYRNDDRFDASNTEIVGDLVKRYEKRARDAAPDPALAFIDYGAIALRRQVIEAIPADTVADLATVQRDLAARGALRAYQTEQRFFEIGSERGLSDLETFLASSRVERPRS